MIMSNLSQLSKVYKGDVFSINKSLVCQILVTETSTYFIHAFLLYNSFERVHSNYDWQIKKNTYDKARV